MTFYSKQMHKRFEMTLVNGLEYLTFYLKEICFENLEYKYFEIASVNGLE